MTQNVLNVSRVPEPDEWQIVFRDPPGEDPIERKIISMYNAGMTYDMMSKELGITPGTISARIQRLYKYGVISR